ncbi:unnamed protein product [Somion occarium]|uniref:HIG1 domain-containing protein n=1 Tax=Somion occarium TaxID=3059160 RepID=A0ABP1CZE2_9APHY
MKIVTKEEQDAQQRATIEGGAKGFFGGLAFALPASYLLNRRWPYYRHLPPSLKALGVIVVVVPSFVISAEKAGQRFERERWTGIGKYELDTVQAREQARWDRMTLGQKVRDVAIRHQYGMIGGAWAISMLAAWGIIMRNPYQTIPQKVVQARMWAQGLTIGVLIAAGVLTHSMHTNLEEDGPVRHLPADHSWKDIIEEEQREDAAQKSRET